jgi:hypothetical protein
MWITKTIFVGSDGNRTIEINESTTKEWAEKKRAKQLERWYDILVQSPNESYDLPSILYDIVSKTNDADEYNFQLDMIQFTLEMKNKYSKPNVKNSFSIEVFESDEK